MTSQRFRALLLLTALALPFSASAVTVDGDLSDLITAVGANSDVGASASESGVDAEGQGFDITNMYLSFDVTTDTLYLGFETNGAVGDGCGTGPAYAGLCNIPSYRNSVFDAQESIGMSLDIGTLSWAANDVQALLTGDSGAGTGPDNLVGSVIPGGVSVSYAVSESNNGVEFGITGLLASGTLGYFSDSNPIDIAVRFSAGSATNPGPEDEAFISATLIPIPAAVWLFGTGLMGLAAFRRKRAE